jgi:hypothetical protein
MKLAVPRSVPKQWAQKNRVVCSTTQSHLVVAINVN